MNITSEENTNITRCLLIPPQVNSLGTWGGDKPLEFPLPALEMQIIVIFILTQLLHLPLKWFRFPRILAEVIAGIILGPTMPKSITKHTFKLFPPDSQEILATLSAFGYALLLFLIGVKSDVTLVMRTGKKAVTIGMLSLIIPFTVGMASTSSLKQYTADKADSIRSVVAIQSLTPFSGIALLLKDLKLLNSEIGRLALSSAAACEFTNVMLITSMNLYRVYRVTKSMEAVYVDVAAFIGFLLIAFLIVRPGMLWIVKQTPEGRDVNNLHLYVVILVALVACAYTHFFDQYTLLGAFIIGLAIPDGPPMGSTLVDKFDSFVSGLLVPLFVTINASRADLRSIIGDSSSVAYFVLIPLIFVVKLASGVIPAWFCNVPLRDALALGLIMCTKGVVEVASYSIARNTEIIKEHAMAIMIITTAVTSVATTTSVRKLYNPKRKYAGYQSRNIMSTKMDGELRIVACLHSPDNINGFINLIDASGPTKQSTMAILFLHLIELHGRASPIFISHQLQKKSPSGFSYSEDILLAARQFEFKKDGAISTQCFTAISPRKLMHEDICTLALDKLASLVIVPFHRKWDFQGTIESEDNALRTLNEKLLDTAPCSVGIFVDRGLVARKSSLSVAMIFFGGNDDREALTYAKRLARDLTISLTVIHCAASEDDYLTRREKILDDAVLKDMKNNNAGAEFVYFVREKVSDGPETATLIRGMIDEYDLIIVGRRHNVQSSQTSGLSEWSEFPELGVIGDFFATMEGKCRASALVIQQQKQLTH